LNAASDAGVDDFGGIGAGLEGAEEFSAAGDIESAPFGGEEFEDVDVAAAFDGIADRGLGRGEGIGDLVIMMEECGLGIDIDRGADVARDFLGGDILAVKLAVFVVEKVHISLIGIGDSINIQIKRTHAYYTASQASRGSRYLNAFAATPAAVVS
jgi:hypothetical protein